MLGCEAQAEKCVVCPCSKLCRNIVDVFVGHACLLASC